MTAEFRLSVCRTLGEPTGIDDRLAWLEKTLGDAFEMVFEGVSSGAKKAPKERSRKT